MKDASLGIGRGKHPEPLIREDLARLGLVALLPDRPMKVALCWQVSRMTGATLAALTRAIRGAAAATLLNQPIRG